MVQLNFKASEIQAEAPRGIIPPQWVVACIVESKWTDTKAGDGKYLALTFQVDSDRHPEIGNRRLWENLNLINKNETAVQIAERDLKRICDATSVSEVTDTEQLHGIPMAIKIAVEAAKGDWPEKNCISDYDAESARFKPGQVSASPAPSPSPSGGSSPVGKPAWML